MRDSLAIPFVAINIRQQPINSLHRIIINNFFSQCPLLERISIRSSKSSKIMQQSIIIKVLRDMKLLQLDFRRIPHNKGKKKQIKCVLFFFPLLPFVVIASCDSVQQKGTWHQLLQIEKLSAGQEIKDSLPFLWREQRGTTI